MRVTLHGDGLLQALAVQKMSDPKEIEKRAEFIKKRGGTVIALSLPQTITQQYADLNKKLHEVNRDYGGHGDRYAKIVRKLAETNGVKSILDYGCGKGALAESLDFPIWEYDPGIEGKEAAPRPADLVVCTDVLEHIEPDLLPAVLEDFKRVIKVTGFFAIHTGAAGKTLPDGRNTHLIQQGMDAWRTTLEKYFHIAYCAEVKGTPMIYIIVAPKERCDTKSGLMKPKDHDLLYRLGSTGGRCVSGGTEFHCTAYARTHQDHPVRLKASRFPDPTNRTSERPDVVSDQ